MQGGFTVPGTLSATSVNSPILATSPASALGTTATTAPATSVSSSTLLPLVYWFGFDEPKKSPALMERRVRELAEQVNQRLHTDDFGTPRLRRNIEAGLNQRVFVTRTHVWTGH